MTALPEAAYAAALAGLERMTLSRLISLLHHREPSAAVAMIVGDLPFDRALRHVVDTDGLVATWRDHLRRRGVADVWERCQQLGLDVFHLGDPAYPLLLRHDRAPAPVLFVRGSFDRLDGRRAGIVGTRNATASGRNLAVSLGAELAANGVHVVSGLARGIDGCAHRGVLQVDDGAAPVAVVASGLDVVYPREHDRLWAEVGERGVLLSEAAPGTPPETFRFPLRNRLIAALSEVLVVVESREAGGSLITVREAIERSVMVMAVPGAVGNRAAKGTNDLLRSGCPVVTDARDVLTALDLDHRRAGAVEYDPRPRPTDVDHPILEMCCEPRTLDQLTLLTGHTLVECAMAVARLEAQGWVRQVNGWFETVGRFGRSR